MKGEVKRSPLFYVGDKVRLVPSLLPFFPSEIDRFIEPFAGGGTVMLNVRARKYEEGDINPYVVGLHRHLSQYAGREEEFYDEIFGRIENYGLSCSYLRDEVPKALKQAYKKTYFARYNKDAYQRMRAEYNRGKAKDFTLLYLLLIYGFNRMVRFNSRGEFNLPVGNVDFNTRTRAALDDYFETVKDRDIDWLAMDFRGFMERVSPQKGDYVYLDPPYLITSSEYNKLWGEEEEMSLLSLLDDLDASGIPFGISNVTHYKGLTNELFLAWAERYHSHELNSNYISYHDNTQKKPREVFVTNY